MCIGLLVGKKEYLMMYFEFLFFDVGEGLIEVEIVFWKVKLGDWVMVN